MARLMTVRLSLLAVVLTFSLELIALPQGNAPTLKPGDRAPKLSIAEWVKGKPVKSLKKGKTYLIALTIVDPKGDIGGRGVKLALKAALAANRLTDGKIPAYLDTLARVHYTKGNIEKAIKVQKTAVKKAKGSRMESQLKRTLEDYKAAEKRSGDEK